MITRAKFKAYETVRRSGLTNMFALATVVELSGLTKKECLEIMENYNNLKEQYDGFDD